MPQKRALCISARMAKTRAIRFSEKEEKLINEFLKKNPFFDFSSLARTSILAFIQNPKLEIKPIKAPKAREETI